jgi:hypothetical protein
VWSSVGIRRVNSYFNPIACCFLYKAKDLSALLVVDSSTCEEDSFFLRKPKVQF